MPLSNSAASNKHLAAISTLARFEKLMGPNVRWYDDTDGLVAWLIHIKMQVSDKTFSQYRKQIQAYARHEGHTEISDNIAALGSDKMGRKTKQKEPSTLSKNRLLATHINASHIKSVGKKLMEETTSGANRYKHGTISLAWLLNTLMLGVRPSEWFGAKLLYNVLDEYGGTTYKVVLEVLTAIKGNHKSDAYTVAGRLSRRLVLDDWTAEELARLVAFMDTIPSALPEFKKGQEAVRQTLIKASASLGMDVTIDLYSGRHFFANEVRDSIDVIYTRYDLAALLGHKDTLNQKFYGDNKNKERARSFDFTLPRPWPATAAQVERIDRARYALVYKMSHGDDDVLEANI